MAPLPKAARFFSLRIRPWDLLIAGGAVFATATMLAFFGRFWWFLELFSHFRVQLFLGLVAATVCALARHRYPGAIFFSAFALANFCAIVPLYLGKPAEPARTSRPYRGLLMNVNTGRGDPAKVGALIKDLQPDILAMEEINERWLSVLKESLRAYPYSRFVPREDNFGIGLFSKYPFIRGEILQVGEAEVPSIVAEVSLPDGRLTVIATHPLPPGGWEKARLRNEQLAQLPAIVKQATSPVLLFGDLNATPWCSSYQRLLGDSGLRDASQGQGVLPTWPTFLPIFLIPLDHFLHSSGIYVRKVALGRKIGSDHYPVVLDFALLPETQRSN